MNITVRRGDTLSSIASRKGVSLQELLRANPQIRNPNLIHPGQQIQLPGTGRQTRAPFQTLVVRPMGGVPPPRRDLRKVQPLWKELIAGWITDGAESAHEVYEFFSKYSQLYSELTKDLNLQIFAMRMVVMQRIDTNPDTLSWIDLGSMWLFEIGPTPLRFGPDARTTKELQVQEGVRQAREKALAQLKTGNLSQVETIWNYGQDEFWNGNLATSFLGSYSTKVSFKAGPGGSTILEFTVDNPSSWESATRLRKAAKPGGLHRGIIPSRSRGGPGLHLGGTMTQQWIWSEPVKK